MKNKIITVFLAVVLVANIVGNFYQYSRLENVTKELAIMTEQRDSLKERNESKEEQKRVQISQLDDLKSRLADLQTKLSELEKEKETKAKLLDEKHLSN